jgi:hypothetical protein
LADNLKVDFINGAFSELRISGITLNPSSEEHKKALDILEDMASEPPFNATGYYFEDDPDPNTPHNVPRKFWRGFKTNLAIKLMSHYGKGFKPDQVLISQARGALSSIYAGVARIPQIQYPSRMPLGRGTILKAGRWSRFSIPQDVAPISPETIRMYIDDVRTFSESFASYLLNGETLSSYTITADTGLTISDDALNDDSTAVNYTITATGSSETGGDPLLELKIVATTSDSRIETRIINFELLDSDIS